MSDVGKPKSSTDKLLCDWVASLLVNQRYILVDD